MTTYTGVFSPFVLRPVRVFSLLYIEAFLTSLGFDYFYIIYFYHFVNR